MLFCQGLREIMRQIEAIMSALTTLIQQSTGTLVTETK